MANATKNAILRAKIEGVLYDLMVKTKGEQVELNDGTTLVAKLSEIITTLNAKATTTQVTEAVEALRTELLGSLPVDAYNTFTELAAYIEEHTEAADALTSAIGNKADRTTVEAIQNTLNGLGALANKSAISEGDLDAALKEKVNAAAEGNHSHGNKAVLDGITAEQVSEWNGKGKIYASGADVSGHAEGELFVQLI